MGRTLSVALAQYPPVTGAQPIGQFEDQAAAICADNPGIDLLVFPEIHLFGDCDLASDPNQWLHAAAEPLTGPRVQALSEVAAGLGVWLIPGSVPELAAGGVYNTQLVFDPTGRPIASYRKVFPWRPYETWSAGNEFTVFDIPDTGRGGLSICYDAWFPESTRSVAWMGAEFVVNVVKTVGADRRQERVLAQANAIVNQVYMLSLNAAGPVGTGGSLVCDPEGTVVADLPGAEPGVLSAVLDLDAVTRVREHGTAGYNRMWSQWTPEDSPIELPIYGGRIDPANWQPRGTS